MKKTLVALVAAALIALPATAHADTTVGGQSGAAGPCDVTLLSVTVNPSTGELSFDVGGADCDLSNVYTAIKALLAPWIACTKITCP